MQTKRNNLTFARALNGYNIRMLTMHVVTSSCNSSPVKGSHLNKQIFFIN